MKKIIPDAAIICVLLFAAYAATWHAWADIVSRAIETFRAELTAQGTAIEGDISDPSGFPGPIVISFSGTLSSDGRALTLPLLTVRGFFLPGTKLRLDLPQGMELQLPDRDAYTSSLDAASLSVTIPNPLPDAFTVPALTAWRDAGGRVDIHELSLRKGPMNVTGHGTLSLDERLQPLLDMPSRVTGHMPFVMELQQRGILDTKQSMIAASTLSFMSKPDENGASTLAATMLIKQSTLYAGMLRVVDVPPLFWPE
jgi:hypothetical protein